MPALLASLVHVVAAWRDRRRLRRHIRRLRRFERHGGVLVLNAALVGKICKVQVGANTIAELDEWIYNPTADVIEKTPFLATSKSHLVGLMDGSGSFKGRLDMTDTLGQVAIRNAMLAGTQVTLNLFTDATHAFRGPALLKGSPMKAGVGTLVEAQYDFQGDGDWAWS